MMRNILLLLIASAATASAHAPVLGAITGPLTTRNGQIVDSTGDVLTLRGVSMPGLEAADPGPNAAAMNDAAFGVIRVRWNMNVVRLPVGVAAWRRDGERYLDRVAAVVRTANNAALAVVLAAQEDAALPTSDTLGFWRACAARFRDNPRVVFSLFRQPSARGVPGSTEASRTDADWRFWLEGGIAAGGARAVGMQELVDTIRNAGAQQLIAVPAFHDPLGFSGLTPERMVRGANLLYELHPYYDLYRTNVSRDAALGSLAGRVPLYAGEWGAPLRDRGPACTSLPNEPGSLTTLVFETVTFFDSRGMSWTAASFEPGDLIVDFDDFQPSPLDRPWICGVNNVRPQGLGEALLLLSTGDPTGFGALRFEQIGNAAGGPAGPLAPGELITIATEQLGPVPGVASGFDLAGRLPVNLAGTQVLFDGVPAPILYTSAFQINAQAPLSLAPGSRTTLQVRYGAVPSNRLSLEVADAAPELFQDFATRSAIALNQDGSRNGPSNPAAPGSIVVLFASGGGRTTPPGETGTQAPSPHPVLILPTEVTVDRQPAEVLFAGEVPGFAGLVQVNARLSSSINSTSSPRPVPVVLRIGARASQGAVSIWIQ